MVNKIWKALKRNEEEAEMEVKPIHNEKIKVVYGGQIKEDSILYEEPRSSRRSEKTLTMLLGKRQDKLENTLANMMDIISSISKNLPTIGKVREPRPQGQTKINY